MDLLPELESVVADHLRAFGFHVRPAGDSGLDLYAERPAAKRPLGVVLKATIPTHKRLALPPGPVVVAAPTISRAQGAALLAAGAVGFLDAAGNARIEFDGIYIHVEGRKPTPVSRAARVESSRGWSGRRTGLQVLFALLTLPELLDGRIADIAEASQVSLATAHRTLTDLSAQGLLGGASMSRHWVDRDGALRSWVEGYTRVVAPKVQESAFLSSTPPTGWVEKIRGTGLPAWVTGGAAVAHLGAGLHPVSATVYLPGDLRPLKLDPRLARPRNGEEPTLFIRRAWWEVDTYPAGVAPLLLVYADSMTSADPRTIAMAAEVMQSVDDLDTFVARR